MWCQQLPLFSFLLSLFSYSKLLYIFKTMIFCYFHICMGLQTVLFLSNLRFNCMRRRFCSSIIKEKWLYSCFKREGGVCWRKPFFNVWWGGYVFSWFSCSVLAWCLLSLGLERLILVNFLLCVLLLYVGMSALLPLRHSSLHLNIIIDLISSGRTLTKYMLAIINL